jgi:hypothetical protein
MSAAEDNLAQFPGVETFARRQPRFKREYFNSVALTSYRWLVKNLWPEVGVCFLGGPSGSGKSFAALNFVTSVCRGLPVLGRKSLPAGVVYIGAEDAGGIRLRMVGLRQEIGELEGNCLELIGQAPDLRDEADVEELREVLEASRDDMRSRGIRLGMVVIDTMSASTPGADENTGKDMGPVLQSLQKLANDLQLLVLMIAHTGKAGVEHGLRGWSGLRANADGLIMLDEREAGGACGGQVIKVKNGPDGDRFGFQLRKVVLGYDDDGDEITTCLVEDCEATETPKGGRKPTKASGTADLIMTAFNRVLDDKGVRISAPGAEGVVGVLMDDLRALAYRIGVGGGEAEIPPDADEAEAARLRRKWQDQRKADFKRGLDHLLATKRLRTEAGYVWELSNKKSPV